MIKIGLTGSIGMGKSETAKIFSGLGVPVYDADASVHKLYEAGNKGALAIKNLYPKAISKDGSVDRKALGDIVVGNKNKIKKLEEIIIFNGGNVLSSISKKTNYLILGDKPGSKYQKAKNLDVEILNEKSFSKLL